MNNNLTSSNATVTYKIALVLLLTLDANEISRKYFFNAFAMSSCLMNDFKSRMLIRSFNLSNGVDLFSKGVGLQEP